MQDFRKAIPSLLFAAALGLQAAFYFQWPGAAGLPAPVRWLAVPVFALGCWFPLRAAAQFRRARTTVFAFREPGALVDDGAFRFSRNPMYLGMLLILLAVALWGNRWPLWLAPALFLPAMNFLVIRWEEAMLQRKWPTEFQAFKEKVPRWFIFRK